jgi:hypothetical protein
VTLMNGFVDSVSAMRYILGSTYSLFGAGDLPFLVFGCELVWLLYLLRICRFLLLLDEREKL